MSSQKGIIPNYELEINRDKKYRLLKNLMYKYQLPIQSVMEKPRQDNFIAYSIVKKTSNSGWFSNQRLLVIDCANKEIFYLTKVPDFVIDQSSPIEIERLRQSPLVKERISLNSFAKQVKSVTKTDNILTIEWQNSLTENRDSANKNWVIQLSSNQLAKDWTNLINIIEGGKLSDPSTVRKTVVVPETLSELKTKPLNNIQSTPKSISDINSLHMKSQNLNFQSQSKEKNNKKETSLTPTHKKENKKTQDENKNQKYFRKTKNDDIKQIPTLTEVSDKNKQTKPMQSNLKQPLKDHQMSISQIAKELETKLPDSQGQKKEFTLLSQQIQEPINVPYGKVVKNKPKASASPNIGYSNLKLYQKYKLNLQDVIHEEGEDAQNMNMLSEQLRFINKREKNIPQEEKEPINLASDVPIKQKRKGISTLEITVSDASRNGSLGRSQLGNGSSKKVNLMFPSTPSIKSPTSFYHNTYRKTKDLPSLQSSYDWNEVYFQMLRDYYNLITSLNVNSGKEQSQLSYSNTTQSRIFDILFKLEKHVEKFQLYCSKGVKNIIEQFVLKNQLNNNNGQGSNNFSEIITIKEKSFQSSYEPIQNIHVNNPNEKKDLMTSNSSHKNANNKWKQFKQIQYQFDTSRILPKSKRQSKRKKKKIIEFSFQGISLTIVFDQKQLSHHHSQQLNGMEMQYKKFQIQLSQIRKKMLNLFRISHLHPFFTESDLSNKINFFHVFTPMVSIVLFQGLKVYCKAHFNPSKLQRYTEIILDRDSVEKSMKKHVNLNMYLRNQLAKTSLIFFREDKLLDKIQVLNLSKELGSHNSIIVENLQLDPKELQQSAAQLARVYTFDKENQQSKGVEGKSQSSKIVDKIMEKYLKFVSIVSQLESNFSNQGAMNLTTHESVKQFISACTSEQILQNVTEIGCFYEFVKVQLYQNKQLLKVEDQLAFLGNRHFLSYLIKILQNEMVAGIMVEQINVRTREFISNLYFEMEKRKTPEDESEDPLFVNIYKVGLQRKNHQSKIKNDKVVIRVEDFSWLRRDENIGEGINHENETVQILDCKSLSSKQLAELVLGRVVNRAMNELFIIQRQQQQDININRRIRIRPHIINWITQIPNTHLTQEILHSLDVNYIYEALLYELNIERYFNPIQPNHSLQEEFAIRTYTDQVQKLIRDRTLQRTHTLSPPKQSSHNNSKTSSLLNSKPSISASASISSQINALKNHNQVEYMARLWNNKEKRVFLTYPTSIGKSLRDSFPLKQLQKVPKIKSELLQVHELIMEKQFNKAIEIYYLQINSNKRTSSIFYDYFKRIKNSEIYYQSHSHNPDLNKKPTQNLNNDHNEMIHSPALTTYVLATQCVAFSFLKLLHRKSQTSNKSPSPLNKIQNKNVSYPQHSQGQKNQFDSLILKYNDMSHLGSQIVFGCSHIIYFINQLIFGFTKLKNKQIIEARLYFEECKKTIDLSNGLFQQKPLILPVLYMKAQLDLKCGHYRSAIKTIRQLMQTVKMFRQKTQVQIEQEEQRSYWIEPLIRQLLEKHIKQLQINTLQGKLESFSHLSYEILILCNENDPHSQVVSNRCKIKMDLIEQMKNLTHFDNKSVKFLKLLWNLQTKIMTNQRRKLIRRVMMKLYDKLVKYMKKENEILGFDLRIILNPLNKTTYSPNYLFAYVVFAQILSKSDKYFIFLLEEFQDSEFQELSEYLHQKMSESFKKPSEVMSLEHYNLKSQLFKDIILILKFMLMLSDKFIFETFKNSQNTNKII